MVWLDIVIGICLAAGLLKGMYDGLVKQVISFISLILAIVFSGMIAGLLRSYLNLNIHSAVYYAVAFILIITGFALLSKVVDTILKATPINTLNRLAGGIFGVLIWLLCLSFALNILSVFDSDSAIINKETQEKSITYTPVKMALQVVYPYIKQINARQSPPKSPQPLQRN
ncbi:MAG: CvpA family protein [Dysgonamonadaceae bacterium]|jgi:membrane protein required for colicin V production|nr:CvpA family protein [Dysgonamonadaceae bacterium]